jgi:hypothetical protein
VLNKKKKKKRQVIMNIGESVEKGNPKHCCWKLVLPLWKTVWRFLKNLKIELLKNLKIELPYDPATLLLSINSKEMISLF